MDLVEVINRAEVLSAKMSDSMKDVVIKDKEKAVETAVNLLMFINCVELFYKKLIKIEQRRNIKQTEIWEAMLDYGISTEFREAFRELKALRNGVVHSVSLTEPLYGYFNRYIKGLSKIIQTNRRMKLIVDDMKEDACYVV